MATSFSWETEANDSTTKARGKKRTKAKMLFSVLLVLYARPECQLCTQTKHGRTNFRLAPSQKTLFSFFPCVALTYFPTNKYWLKPVTYDITREREKDEAPLENILLTEKAKRKRSVFIFSGRCCRLTKMGP